jgi:hypothetical protein
VQVEKMTASFSIDEVSLLVARLVPTLQAGDAEGFVSHHQIVMGILASGPGLAAVRHARAAKPDSWHDDQAVAANMVAWFSQQITTGVSRWAEFFDRKKQDGVWAYRPKSHGPQSIAVDPEDMAAIEGNPKWFFHLMRERDAKIAAAKRQAERLPDGRLLCEACGFAALDVYSGINADLCECHHRIPLSDVVDQTETKLADLAILCPNCHRAIHRTIPLLSVEEFRAKYFPNP